MTDPGSSRCRIALLRDGGYEEREGLAALADLVGAGAAAGGLAGSMWIDLSGPSRDDIETVARLLSLHPLVAEDVIEGNQRSKIELTDDTIHIVLFVLRYEDDEVLTTEVDVVVGKGYLLTVHAATWDPWTTHHLREGVRPILEHGADHLLWALVDTIVDDYFPLIDRLGDAIDELQDIVVERATPETLQSVFRLKRDLVSIRRAVAPIREIFNQLTNRELALIDPDEILWFRDVYDHLIRLTDEVDNYRELVSGTLDVYLSTVNNNLSLIMKRLTGITVVLAGVGAIGGLFGMSEAGPAMTGAEAGGFWFVVGIALTFAAVTAWWLHRIDWV